MTEIDTDKNKVALFLNSPDKYVLCRNGNTVTFKEKGLWTWIKSWIFKNDYSLSTIIPELNSKNIDYQVLQAINKKIEKYNEKYIGKRSPVSWKVEQVVSQQVQFQTVVTPKIIPDQIRRLRENQIISLKLKDKEPEYVQFCSSYERGDSGQARFIESMNYKTLTQWKPNKHENTVSIKDIESIEFVAHNQNQAKLLLESILPRNMDPTLRGYLEGEIGVKFTGTMSKDGQFETVRFPISWNKEVQSDDKVKILNESGEEIGVLQSNRDGVHFTASNKIQWELENQ